MSVTDRLNFFDGFFTFAKDWNEEQSYHIERRKHHLRSFHTPGVVWGLEIRPSDEDPNNPLESKPFGLKIEPGAALDSLGNDLIVTQTTFRDLAEQVPPTGSKLVYLCLKAKSELEVEDENNPGKFKRWVDTFDIEVREQPDETHECVEIARIQLYAGANHLCDNDIDTRHRLQAGSLGMTVRKLLVFPETVHLRDALLHTRKAFHQLQAKLELFLIGDVRSCAINIETQLRNDSLAYRTTLPLVKMLAQIEDEVADEIAKRFPKDTPADQFRGYRTAVNKLLELIRQTKTLTKDKQDEFKLITEAIGEVANCATVLAGITVANAGHDQYNLKSRTAITLDGSLSRPGVSRKITNYHWKVIELNGREPAKPFEVTVPSPKHKIEKGLAPGKYVFQLTVIDDKGHESSPDTMVITVQDKKPVADAGENFWVWQGDDAWLNGSLSIDPDGGKIAFFRWTEIECPELERVPQVITTRPFYNLGGNLAVRKHVFQLVVIDGEGTESDPATVSFEVREKE